MTNSPNLSPTAFWDVDRQTLDYEANARFVIEKVMNYSCNDQRQLSMIVNWPVGA